MIEAIAAALDTQGWCSVDDALPGALAGELATECASAALHFAPAHTGRGSARVLDPAVRSDSICWIDSSFTAAAGYLAVMERLRAGLNQRLYLGLLNHECHYARYAPGSFYAKHRDAFTGERNRVLSTVLYLNTGWSAEQGGELVLYRDDGGEALAELLPQHNRLVVFLSERFPHEVKPATRTRYSIAGWFRIRT